MTDVFSHPSFDDHEQVIFVNDTEADMIGIIAIHNTALGLAAGGCRMQPYETINAALNDVLRLSQGMTMKSAVAGLPLGGGKCVIIADPKSPKKEARLRAMAKQVQRLGGQYWTAIDVGVSAEDADIMAEECEYIFARASQYPDGFRPSQFTALGGFHAIRAVAHHMRGTDDLKGFHVAIQGVGATGSNLTKYLVENGADVTIADVNQEAVANLADKFNVSVVDADIIHTVDADAFAPCALGGVINDKTIPEIKAQAICGLANNQLERPDHCDKLLERNIIYAPDFVVNAGGMMGAATVIFSQPNRERAMKTIEGIYTTVLDILTRSSTENKSPVKIAEEIAAMKIRAGKSQSVL